MTMSHHAKMRAQQRSVPRLIVEWLMDFGEEQFDGHGGIVRYFSNRSVRELERHYGRRPVKLMKRWLRAYGVWSAKDSELITAGWRRKHINRR
jgi:hypothetical protein